MQEHYICTLRGKKGIGDPRFVFISSLENKPFLLFFLFHYSVWRRDNRTVKREVVLHFDQKMCVTFFLREMIESVHEQHAVKVHSSGGNYALELKLEIDLQRPCEQKRGRCGLNRAVGPSVTSVHILAVLAAHSTQRLWPTKRAVCVRPNA